MSGQPKNKAKWVARSPGEWAVDRLPGPLGMMLGNVPFNEVLSLAGLFPRQTLPTRLSFPDAQPVLRDLVSLASRCLWGWPADSSCVCSVPSWGPITTCHPSAWQSATEGSIFVALGNSMPLPCLL